MRSSSNHASSSDSSPSLQTQSISSSKGDSQPVSNGQDEDTSIEDLLYDAQMALIAHQHDKAIWKLEQAVERNSSAACSTLGNLYSKGYCRQNATVSSSVSPPSSTSLACPTSPPLHSTSPPSRPRMPQRSSSWNCHELHAPGSHRSPEAVKATQLFVRGLQIELAKPIESNKQKKSRRSIVSGSEESEEDYERAEGKSWKLETALDLIVGVTDSHRFGVLHPPNVDTGSKPDQSTVLDEEMNDTLWKQSANVASSVLSHPSIAPLLASIPTNPSSSDPPRPPPFLARSASSRRSSSVARSYTHPVSSIPEPGIPHSADRKLQLTVAIHALYILALQAFSSPTPSIPSLPTPDASPVLIDAIPIPDPSPPTQQQCTVSSSHESNCPVPRTESGKALAASLFNLIVLLCPPSYPIGIKEGDELVKRAQRRLDAIRNVDSGEDWRLAKKKKRTSPSNSTTIGHQQQHKGISERLEGAEEVAKVNKTIELSIPSPRGHLKDRSDSSYTTSSSYTITPGGALSRTPNGTKSKFHFAEEGEGEEGGVEDGSRDYPSPPNTPPLSTEPATDSSSKPQLTTDLPLSPKRSPPLASPLQPRYADHHSRSSTNLSRSRYLSNASLHSSSASILSRFKHDPTRSLLRRVESSTSVCTVPPDFGATRLKAGDKGKGKAVDPESLGFGHGGVKFGRGEMIVGSRSSNLGLVGVERDRTVGKSWLSRFFSISAMNTVKERSDSSSSLSSGFESPETGGGCGGGGAKDRLMAALKRDEEALAENVEYGMDWGDQSDEGEFEDGDVEDFRAKGDEDGEASSQQSVVSPGESESEAKTSTTTVNSKTLSPSPTPEDSASGCPAVPRRHSSKQSLRSAKSKRSFMVDDPTSSQSDSLSPNMNTSPRRRNQHRRHPSSSSSFGGGNYLSPLSASRPADPRNHSSSNQKVHPTTIDPLLLELERRSRVGVRTVCQSCHKKGLNFPACRTCQKTYCSRDCRVGLNHPCAVEKQKDTTSSSTSSSSPAPQSRKTKVAC